MAAIPLAKMGQSNAIYLFQPTEEDILAWLGHLSAGDLVTAISQATSKEVKVIAEPLQFPLTTDSRLKFPIFVADLATI